LYVTLHKVIQVLATLIRTSINTRK
jgi:hypothetical protein